MKPCSLADKYDNSKKNIFRIEETWHRKKTETKKTIFLLG
jgi:hypothetical protein